MALPPPLPVVLRTAAVWGTTVVATRQLAGGESLFFGESEAAVLPKPDNSPMADVPIRGVASGWELDARGATGGLLYLRGRKENPVDFGRTGAPIPIVAGDFGVVQYGPNFSVFFQFANAPPMMRDRVRLDWALLLAFLFSFVAVCGGLALVWAITTPVGIPKPLELTSAAELAVQFNLKDEPVEPEKQTGKDDSDKGKGIKDPGAKDKKDMGGGKKIKGAEGQLGKNGPADKTELKGDIKNNLGGMSEVLSSDVGEEVKKTLGTISSVAEALGGLRSDNIVLGRGSGTGLKGSGAGGGGDSDGVPFGSGTLDTGWGPGKGGGFGSGSGGPGGKGLGGFGKGGKGGGNGSGDGDGSGGEKKIKGKTQAAPGQGLTPQQISRVVMSRYGAFRACYESAAASNPQLSGAVSVSWSITPGGSVGGASIGSSSLGNGRVEGCIVRQFNRLSFPTADKPTNAGWTFSFKPSKK